MSGARLWSSAFVVRIRQHGLANALALATYGLGVVFRGVYVLGVHHPRHFVSSDARDLLGVAWRLLGPSGTQTIHDTIWPPGAPAALALLAGADPSLGLAAWFQLVLSALVPLLVAHATWLCAGEKAAKLALGFASLHFGFIHYGGFVLSEQLFQFAVSLAVWLTVLAVRAAELELPAAPTRRERHRVLAWGAAAGAGWALATSVRPNALPIAVLVALALFAHWLRRRERRYLPLLGGVALGLVLGLAPLADRCTRLSHAFCPVSNNVAMNMVLGQAGEYYGIEFKNPDHPELNTGWVPPALLHHGYRGMREVPFSIYDTRQAFAWIWQRLISAPHMFALRALGNAFDLFRLEYWPDDYGRLHGRFVTVLKQSFLLLVIVPGLVGAWLAFARVASGRAASGLAVLVGVLPAALLLVAALSLGEPRYRIPFDGIFVLLAAALYAHALPGAARFARAPARHGLWLGLGGGAALLGSLLIALVSHPKLSLAAHLIGDEPGRAVPSRTERRPAVDFGAPKKTGDAWDGAGAYVFACQSACPELVLDFARLVQSSRIELSTDHNDSYQVTFYREGRALGVTDVTLAAWGQGLRVSALAVPEAARSGFDALGVLPLHGDGRYSLGHLRLRD